MTIALLHNHFNKNHLEAVKSQMLELGIPTIKAVWDEGYGIWAALEGSHRIRAAKELGLSINIQRIDLEQIRDLDVTESDMDLDIDMKGTTFAELFADMSDRKLINFEGGSYEDIW